MVQKTAFFAVCVAAGICHAQNPRFIECADEVGAQHVFSPAPGYPGILEHMVGAVAAGDFNDDGWPDLFALGGGVHPDALFINNTDGTFTDRAAAWGVDARHRGISIAVGDVNRDGLDDIYIISLGDPDAPPTNADNRLLINRGGSFEDTAHSAGVDSSTDAPDGSGCVLGDIDNDGDLDLFTTSWSGDTQGNRLFINTGVGPQGIPNFTDATDAMGVSLDGVRPYTPRMIDINDDRLPDLLITADFETSRLLINEGPQPDGTVRFRDETLSAGITEDTNGMGATFADIDHDGDLDWFITNIEVDYSGFTNTLYMNQGIDPATNAPVFTDEAIPAGVDGAGWAWGCVFFDLDNDGDEDLAVTSGWYQYPGVPARLYRNNGPIGGQPGATPHFTDIAASAGLQFQGLGRTFITTDYDRDGDLDLVMSARDTPLRIWRNTTSSAGNWVQLTLDTDAHPCLAPGARHARVEIDAGGTTRTRVLDNGPTFLGNPEQLAHVGIGNATQIDEARVIWPDGAVTTITDLPVNTRTAIAAHHPADMNQDGLFDLADTQLFVTAFLAGDPAADFNSDNLLDLADLLFFIDALTGSPCNPSAP